MIKVAQCCRGSLGACDRVSLHAAPALYGLGSAEGQSKFKQHKSGADRVAVANRLALSKDSEGQGVGEEDAGVAARAGV